MAKHTNNRYDLPEDRYKGLLARLERRTQAEHRRKLRNAALISGTVGGAISGNYYLVGGTLLWAAVFGVAGTLGCALAMVCDAVARSLNEDD